MFKHSVMEQNDVNNLIMLVGILEKYSELYDSITIEPTDTVTDISVLYDNLRVNAQLVSSINFSFAHIPNYIEGAQMLKSPEILSNLINGIDCVISCYNKLLVETDDKKFPDTQLDLIIKGNFKILIPINFNLFGNVQIMENKIRQIKWNFLQKQFEEFNGEKFIKFNELITNCKKHIMGTNSNLSIANVSQLRDIDLFLFGQFNRKQIILEQINKISQVYGSSNVIVGYIGSVIYIFIKGIPRIIQIINFDGQTAQ